MFFAIIIFFIAASMLVYYPLRTLARKKDQWNTGLGILSAGAIIYIFFAFNIESRQLSHHEEMALVAAGLMMVLLFFSFRWALGYKPLFSGDTPEKLWAVIPFFLSIFFVILPFFMPHFAIRFSENLFDVSIRIAPAILFIATCFSFRLMIRVSPAYLLIFLVNVSLLIVFLFFALLCCSSYSGNWS